MCAMLQTRVRFTRKKFSCEKQITCHGRSLRFRNPQATAAAATAELSLSIDGWLTEMMLGESTIQRDIISGLQSSEA